MKSSRTIPEAEYDEEESDDSTVFSEDTESTAVPEGVTAGIVIVDCELSPSQLRNLESAFGVEVLDRTGVIIEIFHDMHELAPPNCKWKSRA